MGLKSILKFFTWPLRALWEGTNEFLPRRVQKMDAPTIIKDAAKTEKCEKPQPEHHEVSNEPLIAQAMATPIKMSFTENAPPEKVFYLQNGTRVYNLNELAGELAHMDATTFFHHVTPERNDFANWVGDIFHLEDLAQELRAEHDLARTRAVIERHRL